MARKDWRADPAEIQRSIEEAIQDLGLLIDSGRKKWSQRTGRYEIVWASKLFGKTFPCKALTKVNRRSNQCRTQL
jgi:hypothetical protein